MILKNVAYSPFRLILPFLFTMFAGISAASDFKIEFGKAESRSRFESETQSIWGGSLVKGDEGKYHIFYSRWPKEYGWAWVTHSEIAHAVSDSPFGPFTHNGVALSVRGAEYWDGLCTHNPTIHKFDGKYYLYYMGNTGDGKVVGSPGVGKLNWSHRNNQRIGVAVADNPYGPWKRFDTPLINVGENDDALDALMTSNPSVCQRPDGGYLLVYKCVGKKRPLPGGGPVVHCIATSDHPAGPFKKHDKAIFTRGDHPFPAEDPYIWYQDGKYRAIVKRMNFTKKGEFSSLIHYDSLDGFDWKPAKHHQVSERVVNWTNGETTEFHHLERPQVFIENGQPVAILCAADTIDEKNVRHSLNIQIPLIIKKE